MAAFWNAVFADASATAPISCSFSLLYTDKSADRFAEDLIVSEYIRSWVGERPPVLIVRVAIVVDGAKRHIWLPVGMLQFDMLRIPCPIP